MKSRKYNQTSAVSDDAVVIVTNRVLSLVSRRSTPWVGTMTELYNVMTKRSLPENFPGSASSLRRVVNSAVSSLNRRYGVSVSFSRTPDHERRRLVTISKSV